MPYGADMSIKTGVAYFKVLVPDAESIPDFDSFVRGSALQLEHHLIADWKVDSSACPFVILTAFLHSDRDENGILDVAIAADVSLMLDGVSEKCVIVTASPRRIKPDPERGASIKAEINTAAAGGSVTPDEQEGPAQEVDVPVVEVETEADAESSATPVVDADNADCEANPPAGPDVIQGGEGDLSEQDIPQSGDGLPFWKSVSVATVESDADQSFIEATALKLSRTAFMKNVDKESLKFIEVHLGYCAHHRQGPTMAHDEGVHYYRFKQDDTWIYFFEREGVRFYFKGQ